MGLKKHLNYLKKDFSGEVLFIFDLVLKKIITSFSSMAMLLYAKLFDIKIGKHFRANGLMLISRSQCSHITIGDDCVFSSLSLYNYRGLQHRCILQTGSSQAHIKIGNNCRFSGVSIVCDDSVVIGNNVRVGANTTIADRDGHGYAVKPVRIEDGVWLGMNVQILKGVSIGKNSIIGAGSIVTKDIPENVVAAGSPCKVIKEIV